MSNFLALITLISTVGFAVGLFNDYNLTNKFGAVALISYLLFIFVSTFEKWKK
jgi:hypothetical protein